MSQQYQLAQRPQRSQNCPVERRPVPLLANYYAFKFTNPRQQTVFKYTVDFAPQIPDNSTQLRKKLISTLRAQLKEKYLGFFIYLGTTCLYSLENSPEIPVMQACLDG